MAIHSPEDAVSVADMIAFVADGRVNAAGPPAEILAPGRSPELDRYFRRPG
ncbi:hypothetical protein D3C83_299730 [compost metagenome]